jgi:hypothetical protein
MIDRNFDEFVEGTEKTAWEAFRLVVDNFLVTTKRPTTDSWLRKHLKPTEWWGALCRWKYTSFILTCISYLQTLQTSASSMVKGFSRTRRNATRWIRKRRLTTAVSLKEKLR